MLKSIRKAAILLTSLPQEEAAKLMGVLEPKEVEAVTIESIKDAFKRRIQPDKLVTVMVGGEK